ncbi:MAG: hypothetical protein FWH03_01220 [Firmicutes bacterium]|nr:hypothetical protein [Bacillota bacterium]
MPNYIKTPSSSRRKISVTTFGGGMNASLDESVLPLSVAKRIYNFDFSAGALTEGYGLEAEPLSARAITNIWTFKRHDFDTAADEEIIMFSDIYGKVYYLRGGTEHELSGISFTSVPQAVTYRLYGDDVILLTSETDAMAVWDGKSTPYTVPDSPLITSMAMHYERMFCTVAGERNAVWFSSDLDPTNWDLELDKGGFIQMLDERGKLNKVISYLNYIYIFRDYGISRLSAFADQSDFFVGNLFVSSGKIYARSVALCGDCVLFLASDGIYRFDGLSTRKILSAVSPLVLPSAAAAGVFHEGKYYLSFRAAFDESDSAAEEQNNAVLVYDLKNGAYSILKGASVTAFASKDERLIAVTADGRTALLSRCGHVFGEPTVKKWTSGLSDLGTERIKTVRELYIESDDAFTLTVESENTKREFFVLPEAGITKVRANVRGRKIGVTLTAHTAKARLTRPTVIFSS